jgi:hypothetical protein
MEPKESREWRREGEGGKRRKRKKKSERTKERDYKLTMSMKISAMQSLSFLNFFILDFNL